MNAPTKWYAVPAGTRATPCRGATCRVRMYWVTAPNGLRVPVDCDVPGGERPSETAHRDQADMFAPGGLADVHDGRGVSHLPICPDRDQFPPRGAR